MDPVALRKLVAGILCLLIASGVIKWEEIQERRGLRIIFFCCGLFLTVASPLYQFGIIPESQVDAWFRGLFN